MHLLNDHDVPIGFGMSLSQNLDALNTFSNLSDAEKQQIIQQAKNAKTKEDMERIIHTMS